MEKREFATRTHRRGFSWAVVPMLVMATIWTSTGSTCVAQEWAKAMFKETSHDFGFVAKGAAVEHRFRLENIYEEDVHIVSITSSCGCTTPTVTKDSLKTYETADIVARLDTKNFKNRKDATLRVVFDKPFPAEVQLHVHSYIRTDVVLEPGAISFGSVREGEAAIAHLKLSYAGRNDWGLVAIKRDNPHLDVKATETTRGGGLVSYDVQFDLKADAPAGYLRDHVRLITNDLNSNATEILVAVEGTVVKAVSVSPEMLALGILKPGRAVSKVLAIRAMTPFQVTGVTCDDPRFRLSPVSPETKTVHLIPVVFTADTTVGDFSTMIRINTNLSGDSVLEVPAQGSVGAAE